MCLMVKKVRLLQNLCGIIFQWSYCQFQNRITK